jgi:hypothetical protein
MNKSPYITTAMMIDSLTLHPSHSLGRCITLKHKEDVRFYFETLAKRANQRE